MNMETDALIVGAGPSGTICGIRLRQAGVNCIVVDRATFPRVKLCAGVLTRKSRDVLAEVLGNDSEALLQETRQSHESHLRLWNKKECFVDCDFTDHRQIPPSLRGEDWRFTLVDRPAFDLWLLRHYKSLGGTAIEGDGVRAIDFTAHKARLASGEVVSYKWLVACDGANSHMERLLGKHDAGFQPKGANAEAYEINVDRSDLDIDGINVCFGYVPQTYAWAFAKGDKTCLGLCKLSGAHFNGPQAMNNFCDDFGLQHAEKYPLQAAMIPFDNAMPNPLWHDEVFFCGDAAGLDEALTGEGIFYALRSGTDAAESIISGNASLYLKRNRRLQALMHKAAKYQRVVASPKLYPLFKAIATHDNRFVGYFYLTQIDHSCLNHLPAIYWNYLKELRLKRL